MSNKLGLQARAHTPDWWSLPIRQCQWPSSAPGSARSPQAGLGLARLPQTPRAPHGCCPCAPVWQSLNGRWCPGQGLLHLYPHLRQEAPQRVWSGPWPGGQGRAPTGISSHSYKLSSRAIGTCKETVPMIGACPEGLLSSLSQRHQPRPFPEPLGGSAGLSSPGGHLTICRGSRAHGGCLLDPPPCPHAQAPAPRLQHLVLNTQTPQTRHCRPRTLSSAEGVLIQLEIRRERSFTLPR